MGPHINGTKILMGISWGNNITLLKQGAPLPQYSSYKVQDVQKGFNPNPPVGSGLRLWMNSWLTYGLMVLKSGINSQVEVGSGNPIIYRVSYIPGGAGFQPSTVVGSWTTHYLQGFLVPSLVVGNGISEPSTVWIPKIAGVIVWHQPKRFYRIFRVKSLKTTTDSSIKFDSPNLGHLTLEVKPSFLIGWFPNHHYFSRGHPKEPPFFKWWLTSSFNESEYNWVVLSNHLFSKQPTGGKLITALTFCSNQNSD